VAYSVTPYDVSGHTEYRRKAAMSIAKYEDAAQAFLQAHPVGSTVRADQIITWAHDHADGLASDLLVDDTSKKLSALRRHLNTGATSLNLAETDRFYLDVTDAKRGLFIVREYAEYVERKAEGSFGKAVKGALAPFRQSAKAYASVKLEALDDDRRAQIEAKIKENADTYIPFQKVCSEQVVGVATRKLMAKGCTKEQARIMIEMWAQPQIQNLLDYTNKPL
jgi:hypothetical protein